ncbi:MAG: hypothetical protein M4579_003399 [Chaenotheca gracillima]|nr:MAG: hypothetical protein M4579_003399 [Chaenotheca gracillima]
MSIPSILLSLLGLALCALVEAHSGKSTYYPPRAKCVEYLIPVSVSTPVLVWNTTKWEDNYGLVDYVSVDSTRVDAGFPGPVTTSPEPYTGSFKVAATFCTPKHPKNGREKTVLLASHGLGFDRGYWNSAYEPEKYNFVQFAIDQGYSVFFYDRIGTGKSSIGLSGFVNQGAIQVKVLGSLASLVKSGKYTSSIGTPKSLVLVGHSFGSFISNALVAESPKSADAVILTGIAYAGVAATTNEAFDLHVASLQNPRKWSNRDPGYVTWGDVYANINTFFKKPLYTVGAVEFTDATKQPFAIAELVTVGLLNFDASKFTGPALYLNGEFDFLICGGYCPGVADQPARTFFSGSRNFQTRIQPNTGHGLNFHKNAIDSYTIITDFLQSTGF